MKTQLLNVRHLLLLFGVAIISFALASVPERNTYTVQVASYNNLMRAVVQGKKLQEKGLSNLFVETIWLDSTRRAFRLVAGRNTNKEILSTTLRKVQELGHEDAFVKVQKLETYIPIEKIKAENAHHPYNTLNYEEHGIASFYAHKFHKKYTSNGEVYDMDGISAAHQKIQFNSLVRVTNKKNGKQVTVRINDRGPFMKNRILDLSRGAARKLGMVNDGIVPISLEVIRVGSDGPRLKSVNPHQSVSGKKLYETLTYDVLGAPRRATKYGVQIASYDVLRKAVDLGYELKSKGYPDIYIQHGWTDDHQVAFRVIVGDRAKSLARADQRNLVKEYPGAFVKSHFNF
ncbi:MAG: septal ring lytic transglycosylase RlpA family protein [Bacteroidota bacterium]